MKIETAYRVLVAVLVVGLLVFTVGIVRIRDKSDEVRHEAETAEGNRQIDVMIEADNQCLRQCASAGYGSLNGFYEPRRVRCLCQEPGPPYDDFTGYRFLRQAPDGGYW